MPIIVMQPPFVQLNGPYPSGAYLSAFFRGLSGGFAPRAADFSASRDDGTGALPPALLRVAGHGVDPSRVRWIDASNGLFRRLFSRAGLSLLFSRSRDAALARADRAEASGDAETAFQLRRFVSTEARWVSWIEPIVSILTGADRELCHALVRSPHAPRGARVDAFFANLGAEPSSDDARLVATLALEDIADYVVAAFDPEFSLVRYAESIAQSERSFANIEKALAGPFVESFVAPYADALWDDASVTDIGVGSGDGPFLLCVTVPFPGCLIGALAIARSARRRFGDRVTIAMGGGYVNTELRGKVNPRLSDYVDVLSFDRGFAGFAALLCPDPIGPCLEVTAGGAGDGPVRLHAPAGWGRYEARVTESIVPDYSDVDFSRYPRLADDPNPMHRLWSDGAWVKAFLAHGCYWHRCSFCDVSLDYVAGYRPVAVSRLYAGLRAQCLSRGVRGVHLVDEAAPPRALRDFARENLLAARAGVDGEGADGGGLLSFWGNIRFERAFTRDLADFLGAAGLVGVSGGIEIASEEGFKSVDKGLDLDSLVASCAAFKEAGVLVHAYLIYGYWNEDAQGVVDATETMRQLFAEGLVDSAFWHKFVLTRHSRVYAEWKAGLHRGARALEPIEEPGDFADNDLRFKGERDSERYGAPLDAALRAWMAGEGLDRPVRSWFPFPMPSPRVEKDLVAASIARYEEARDRERSRPCDPSARYWWTASRPVAVGGPSTGGVAPTSVSLSWWHLGEECSLVVEGAALPALYAALGFGALPEGNAPCNPESIGPAEADAKALASFPRATFKALRKHGLARIGPLG